MWVVAEYCCARRGAAEDGARESGEEVRAMTKGSTYHDAGNGRFVSPTYVDRHPNTTVQVTNGARPTNAPRDAGNGRFVSDAYADRHPGTTVESK